MIDRALQIEDDGRYGLIAGNGRFPFLVLEGARREGIEPLEPDGNEGWFSGPERTLRVGFDEHDPHEVMYVEYEGSL